MATEKPILIAGAGIASLLLAHSLRRSGIPFKIFERDASFIYRAQGYRLRLSAEGLDAIESVLGPETFQRFWDACGKTQGRGFAELNAITGETITSRPSAGPAPTPAAATTTPTPTITNTPAPTQALVSRDGKVVGIARGTMRKIFASGSEDHIEWSRDVVGYEHTPTGVRAIFADGTKSIEGALLIGGDGIRSKIAKQVSQGRLKVFDTGARGIHGQAPTGAFKGLGEGVFILRDETRPEGSISIITNVRPGEMDDPDVQFGWTMIGRPGVIQPPPTEDINTLVGKPAADVAQALTQNWHPSFKPLFDQMNVPEAAFWRITCSSPSGVPEWPNDARVTVLGDAVHSMTPAGGNGANTAVRGAALLGRLLGEAGGWKEGVTEVYEREIRVLGSKAVRDSYETARVQFGVEIDEERTPVV